MERRYGEERLLAKLVGRGWVPHKRQGGVGAEALLHWHWGDVGRLGRVDPRVEEVEETFRRAGGEGIDGERDLGLNVLAEV